MCSRDLTLLRLGAVLRASVCFDAYERDYSLFKKKFQVGNRTKNHPFLIEWNMDRYSVTGIDYRRNCDRAYNGWPIGNRPTTDYNGAGTKYTVKALKTFANLQPRDDPNKSCLDLPQRHCQQCNVCFDCLIYYDNESLMRCNQCEWYEAHFRNGLRISVLDEDLSQAQLAQLEEFLEVDVDFILY